MFVFVCRIAVCVPFFHSSTVYTSCRVFHEPLAGEFWLCWDLQHFSFCCLAEEIYTDFGFRWLWHWLSSSPFPNVYFISWLWPRIRGQENKSSQKQLSLTYVSLMLPDTRAEWWSSISWASGRCHFLELYIISHEGALITLVSPSYQLCVVFFEDRWEPFIKVGFVASGSCPALGTHLKCILSSD